MITNHMNHATPKNLNLDQNTWRCLKKSEVDESDDRPEAINEPIVFIADDADADKPISIDDLQAEIKSKHVESKPTFSILVTMTMIKKN